jgi:hypothetical protein
MATSKKKATPTVRTAKKKPPAKKAAARKTTTKKAPARKRPARKAAAAPRPAKARATRRRTDRDLQAIRPTGFATAADRVFWAERCRTTVSGPVTVHCGDLSKPVLDFIDDAPSIVGCVAWLTSKPLLEALARVPEVALLVQKERNLREGEDSWSVELRRRYAALGTGPMRRTFPGPLAETDGPARIEPIRCVGYLNSGANPNAPRLHHKFLVAGETVGTRWVPQRVWTGSFNFSANAGNSAENAVVIDDPVVAAAYLDEFSRMAAISEPLAWASRMSKPALRRRAGAVKAAAAA